MILGIDVGGTKTLLGLFNNEGNLERTKRTLTNDLYDDFITTLSAEIPSFLGRDDVDAISIGMPGSIDRTKGSVIAMGHRPWKNCNIVDDLRSKLMFKKPVFLENDAKLAGLAEAQVYKDMKTIVYVTISTGINTAILIDGILEPSFIGDEGGFMLVPHEGKLQFWDTIASGRAFKERFGVLASETNDPAIWKEHCQVLAPGFSAIRALLTPDLIITGGGLGIQLEKFREPLLEILSIPGSPNSQMPEFVAAKYGDNSVMQGCYTLATLDK